MSYGEAVLLLSALQRCTVVCSHSQTLEKIHLVEGMLLKHILSSSQIGSGSNMISLPNTALFSTPGHMPAELTFELGKAPGSGAHRQA